MERRILGQEDGFTCQFDQFLFPIGAPGIEDLGNMPMKVRSRSDDVPVHRPVVVLAEREAVGGVS